jgi:hypothetical protein
MPTSKRQSLVTALDTRLKTLLTTGGYETNLGQNVQWYRQEPFTETESGISCEDSEPAPEWLGVGVHLHRLTVAINVVLPAGAAAPEIRKAAADVVKAIGTDLTFGGLAEDCVLGEMPMAVGQEAVRSGGTVINLVIEYTTEPWNAYA